MGVGGPGEPDFVVPDDAAELEPDRQAWLSEQRSRRRRARARRLVYTRRWERFGLSGPIVALCLAATAAVGALIVVFVPRPASPFPTARPLATAATLQIPPPAAGTSTDTGQANGPEVAGRLLPRVDLLPDVPDAGGAGVTHLTGGAVGLQELRPALLLLVPADLLVPAACGCVQAVGALYRQAREFQLTTWYLAVDAPQARAHLAGLDADASAGGARWAIDPTAALARAIGASGLTAVLVRADGVVTVVLRDLPLDPARLPALELDLAQLPLRSA